MSEQNEKKEGSCCKSSCGCGGKKFFFGLIAGALIVMVVKCLMAGGFCSSQKAMCPMTPQMQMQTK